MNDAVSRFLIVNGLPIFRVGMEEIISRNFNGSIQFVEKSRDALALCAKEHFDLILLSITHPKQNGLDLMPDFHNLCPNSPVLVVSPLAEEDFGLRALKAGAAGYISKTSSIEEFILAIKLICSGNRYISQALAGQMADSLAKSFREIPHESLSPREFDVFLRVASGSNAKEIAQDLSLSVKTISTYHTHIFEKLHVRTDAELGAYALRHRLIE